MLAGVGGIALIACGRLGFDERTQPATGDAPAPDAVSTAFLRCDGVDDVVNLTFAAPVRIRTLEMRVRVPDPDTATSANFMMSASRPSQNGFAGVGIELPHYTGYQYTSGPQVPLSQIKRGDMIFYGPNASQHVALYLGDGKMVEAPQSGSIVKVSPLRTDGAMPMVVRLL